MLLREVYFTSRATPQLQISVSRCHAEQENAPTYLLPRITLTARLYTNVLLNRQHFIDWIVRSFENATEDHLASILVLVAIWHHHICSDIRRANKIAVTCLSKRRMVSSRLPEVPAENTSNIQHTAIGGVLQRFDWSLHGTLSTLILEQPLAFTGTMLEPDLFSTSALKDHDSVKVLKNIKSIVYINKLTNVDSKAAQTIKPPASQHLVHDLNSALTLSVDGLQETLASHMSLQTVDVQALIKVLLIWASTHYSVGPSRVYDLIRLMKFMLERLSIGLDEVLTDCLMFVVSSHSVSDKCLGRIVAELCRHGMFNVAMYLRRLIATGALQGSESEYYVCLDPEIA